MPIGKAEQKALMVGAATACILSKGWILGVGQIPKYILPVFFGAAGAQYFLSRSTSDWTSTEGLDYLLKEKKYIFLHILISYLAARTIMGRFLPEQIIATAVKEVKISPFLAAKLLGHVVLLAPITEEILFRGFLQEGIGEVQFWCGNESVELRVALQALIFGCMHIESHQSLAANLFFVGQTALAGYHLGRVKEECGSLALPMALHSLINSKILLLYWLP